MANYTTVDEATAAIKAHSVCAVFQTTPGFFVVYYPNSYRIPGGASVKRGTDDLSALNQLYDTIDRFWTTQRLKVAAQ
jgi:hypothetical protein